MYAYWPLIGDFPVAAFTHLLLALTISFHVYCYLSFSGGSVADAAVITFSSLFSVIAPALQLANTGGYLVNTIYASDYPVALANISIAALVLFYVLTRYSFGFQYTCAFHGGFSLQKGDSVSPFGAVTIAIVGFLAVLAVQATLEKFGLRDVENVEISIKPGDLIYGKFLLFIPAAAMISYAVFLSQRPKWNWIEFAILAVFIFFAACSQNPVLEKRNSLGPVYFSLCYVLARRFLWSPVRVLLFALLPVIVFLPIFSLFTHVSVLEWGGKSIAVGELIYEHFTSINYDAWANSVAVVQMVEMHGFRWGWQLLGDVLFFVPRDFWPSKPVPTGIEIGEYLMQYYAGWFTNLSAPLSAEAYMDFGLFGCCLAGFALAVAVAKLEALSIFGRSTVASAAAIYFSFYLIFLLRGTLMVAIAYGTANALAFSVLYFVEQYRKRRAGVF